MLVCLQIRVPASASLFSITGAFCLDVQIQLSSFKMMRLILLLSICVAPIKAGCPQPTELLLNYSNNKFLCARLYDHNHHLASLSCRGDHIDVYNGDNKHSAGNYGWNDRVASLVVSKGCRLDVFEDGQYAGDHKQYTGIVPDLGGWNDEMSSWSCSCDFSNAALTCTPSEEYYEITRCENTSPGSADCDHSVQKGLSIGYSVTQGNSISSTVGASLGAVFKKIFSLGLSASTTTDYSWSTTDSSTFSEVRTISISCEVPTGHTIRILQVVGRCGDTVVYTSHYKCA